MKRKWHVYRSENGSYVGPAFSLSLATRVARSIPGEPGQPVANIYYQDGDDDIMHYYRTVIAPCKER